jgi:nitrogen-specific signal transduction histidine kinase
VEAPLAGLTGVLSGSPTGLRQEAIEEIIQPLAFTEGAAQLLQTEGIEPEARSRLLMEIEQQAARLRELLARRFGVETGGRDPAGPSHRRGADDAET